MSGVVPAIPKFQFPDSSGAPLSGGFVDVYVAGTTTRTDTWQDSALTTRNTNPIELDSAGRCSLWILDSLRYKFVVKNSSDVAQYTVDNVFGAASLADAVAAAVVGAQAAQAAAETARDLALGYAGAQKFSTKAAMDADLAHAAGTFAYVYADATVTNNGVYYKIGASGAGSWAAWTGDRMSVLEAILQSSTSAPQAKALQAFKDWAGNVLGYFALDGGLLLGADTTSVQKQIDQNARQAYSAAAIALSAPLNSTNAVIKADRYEAALDLDTRRGASNPLIYQPIAVADTPTNVAFRIPSVVRVQRNQLLMICSESDSSVAPPPLDTPNSRLVAYDIFWDDDTRTLTTSAKRIVVDYRSITSSTPGVTAFANGQSMVKVVGGTNAGRIYLFYQTNKANPDTITPVAQEYKYSDDDGQTWSAAASATALAAAADGSGGQGTEYAYGCGTPGVQLRYGQYAGRIIMPFYIASANGLYMRFICLYSDNGGTTWAAGGRGGFDSNETSVAEDMDGTLYASCRKDLSATRFRDLYSSSDGGVTWTRISTNYLAGALTSGCIVQAGAGRGVPKFITSHVQDAAQRADLNVRLSYGVPSSFNDSVQIESGFAGYSVVEMLNEADGIVIYERNEQYIDSTGAWDNGGTASSMESISACVFSANPNGI